MFTSKSTITRAVQANATMDYLPLRSLVEQKLGRKLRLSEKSMLVNAIIASKTRPTVPKFKFLCHTANRSQALAWSPYNKNYAMMPLIEMEQQLSTVERSLIGPTISIAARYGVLMRQKVLSKMHEQCILESTSGAVNGSMLVMPFLPKDYFHPMTQGPLLSLLKRMVAAEVAHGNGSPFTMGLGALNKNITFSDNGRLLAEAADAEVRARRAKGQPHRKLSIVTGNTMTAAVVFANVVRYIGEGNKGAPIFINGATSNIGRAVITTLVAAGYTSITFHSNSTKRANKLKATITAHCGAEAAATVTFTADAAEMWNPKFRHCVIGSSWDFPKRPVAQQGKPPMFLGFAFPLPKDMNLTQPNCVDAGKLQLPKTMCINNQLGCEKDEMYACFCGTAVHSAMGWQHHEVGEIDLDAMSTCFAAAMGLGFALPPMCAKRG